MLDRIGDTTTSESREAYFSFVDKDQSSGVDFEEFLEVSNYCCVPLHFGGEGGGGGVHKARADFRTPSAARA